MAVVVGVDHGGPPLDRDTVRGRLLTPDRQIRALTGPNSFAPGGTRRHHGVMAERFDVVRDGARLAAERWPGSGQTVVLLHEGVADRRGWAEVAGLLAPELTVVAYDRR